MATEIVVPELGESVVEATVGEWLKRVGDAVQLGEVIVELETDKVDVEVGATAAGVLTSIAQPQGADVRIGDVLGVIDENGAGTVAGTSATDQLAPGANEPTVEKASTTSKQATPVARRAAEVEGIPLDQITGTGPGGRVTKQDVVSHAPQSHTPVNLPVESAPATPAPVQATGPRREERQRLSRRRRTIAQRLVEAQHNAAMLTTFNEVDMGAVMALRQRRQEGFVARHGIKLGFMSFFVKATIGALKAFPRLNAELDGDELVLKHYYDIGIAVGAEEGLVVPVIRDADRKTFAEIEKEIKDLSTKATDGTLSLEELRGGTFTITNGGIFGSMMSTPILNPPQVGILGMHAIQQRPVARNEDIVIRPMMYLALSYDHRIVDGREAVQFLVRVKQLIEDPEALLLEG